MWSSLSLQVRVNKPIPTENTDYSCAENMGRVVIERMIKNILYEGPQLLLQSNK